MGSYYIPSNKLKGENRILYIFTGKSLIYTAIGAFIGLIFYFIFTAIGLGTVGIIIMAVLAGVGYGIGTIKVPTNGTSKLSKNVGGESIDEIIWHYINFKKKKKVYSYAVPRKNPDYESYNTFSSSLLGVIDEAHSKRENTKEDKK